MQSPLREVDYFKTWILLLIGGLLSGGVIGTFISALIRTYYAYYPMSSSAPRVVGVTAIVVLALGASYALFRFLVSRLIVRRLAPVDAIAKPPAAA